MKFEADNSRSPEHGLTIVNSYLKNYEGQTMEALEALTIKATLLDKRLKALNSDPKEADNIRTQRDEILRYLISRGSNVAQSVELLAKEFIENEEYVRAQEVLERANSLKPVPASILQIRADVFQALNEAELRKDTLYTLSTLYPDTEEGKKLRNFCDGKDRPLWKTRL